MLRLARIGRRGTRIVLCLLAVAGLVAVGLVLWRGQDATVVAIVVASKAEAQPEAPGGTNRTPKPEEAATPPGNNIKTVSVCSS